MIWKLEIYNSLTLYGVNAYNLKHYGKKKFFQLTEWRPEAFGRKQQWRRLRIHNLCFVLIKYEEKQ